MSALLKIHALCQNIGCDHDIEIVGHPWRRFRRLRGEAENRFLSIHSGARLVALYRDQSATVWPQRRIVVELLLQILEDPIDGVRIVAKDQNLSFLLKVCFVACLPTAGFRIGLSPSTISAFS